MRRRTLWLAAPLALAVGALGGGCILIETQQPDPVDEPTPIEEATPGDETRGNPDPEKPGEEDPANPWQPGDPSDPGEPSDPSDPSNPSDPSDPSDPGDPTDPNPNDPVDETLPGALEELLMTADGGFLLSLVEDDKVRCLAITDLEEQTTVYRDDLCSLQAMAADGGSGAYLLAGDGRTVSHLRLPDGTVETVHVSEATSRALIVSPGGTHLALANLPQRPADVVVWEQDPLALWARRVELVDLETGASQAFVTSAAVRDVDLTADRMLVTSSKWDKFGVPWSTVQTWRLGDMDYDGAVEFPNCADDLKIQPEGTLAVLAPRTCVLHDVVLSQPEVVDEIQEAEDWDEWEPPPGDPVSIIDFTSGAHLGNVPGFGPVEWSPDGSRVAGFTDRQTLMVEWNTFQNDPFGVIVVTVDDLKWDLISVGDERPQYAFSPDGGHVLVHSAKGGAPLTAGVAVGTASLEALAGPATSLRERVHGPDGALITTDGGSLYRIAAGASAVETVAVGATGDRLHARPQGDIIVWTDRAAGLHHLLDSATLSLLATIELPAPIAP